jgi:putative cardiolipin synthase
VAGPLVADVSASFDTYWNSSFTYPLAALAGADVSAAGIAELRTELAGQTATLGAFPLERADWSAYFEELAGDSSRGRGELYQDAPNIDDPQRQRLYPRFKQLVAGAEHEVLISSPYFIPDQEFADILRALVARGVRVVVVTNSLASNNHTVAHTGYRRWRRTMLEAGVELYELRTDAAALALYVTPPVTTETLGLHTKAVVVDGRRVFIGSPNVDPRSMVLNTEIGVVADSAELATRMGALIERDTSPENAWRVTMDGDGWLTWTTAGETVRRQPARNFRQRMIEFLLNLLPLKKQV